MFEAVVIGVSAGGMQALKVVLSALPKAFPVPIVIVQHVVDQPNGYLAEILSQACSIAVKEGEDKEPLQSGMAYIAPPGYHLLIEPDRSLSLSEDEKVNYCRPSVDVLFESAADAFNQNLIGVILTGANSDGALGLKKIKERGGCTVVQNPKTAEASFMPQAAMKITSVDYLLDLEGIGPLLVKLNREGRQDGTEVGH